MQLLITLIATPIMTRIYAPEAYAVFGILYGIATVAVGIGLLSLPNAMAQETNIAIRRKLLRMSYGLLLLVFVIVACAAITKVTFKASLPFANFSDSSLLLLPVLVVVLGLQRIAINTAIISRAFDALAVGRVVEPLVARGGAIGLAMAFGGQPILILLSIIAGHALTFAAMLRLFPRRAARWLIANLRVRAAPWSIVRDYHDFALYCTLSSQIQPLVILGLQLTILTFYDQQAAGQFVLAMSVINMPVMLIAMTTASITMRHFIDVRTHHPGAMLRDLVIANGLYLVVGSLVLVPLSFFGAAIFAFIFSAPWTQAGEMAAMLSLPFMVAFANVGVQGIFRVLRQLRLQFYFEAVTGIALVGGAVYCFATMAIEQAVITLAMLWLIRNLIEVSLGLAVTYIHSRRGDAT